ncbi:MAG: hypothetical protein ACRDZO_16850 [Egibacteraceae bacterium]
MWRRNVSVNRDSVEGSGLRVPGLGEETGPRPAVRVATGLLLGLGVGLLSARLLPRNEEPLTSSVPMTEPRSTAPTT